MLWRQRVVILRFTRGLRRYDFFFFLFLFFFFLFSFFLHLTPTQKNLALAAELQAKFPQQLFRSVVADLSSREAVRNLVPSVLADAVFAQKHTAVSILVANAGLGRRIRDIANIEEDDWDEMFEVNARSQFVVAKGSLPGMRAQRWGRVIFVGSIASKGGGINGCHYAAAKGAMR